MKKTVLLIFALVFSMMILPVAAREKESALLVSCDVADVIAAKEAYLLFLLDGKGMTVSQALQDYTLKEKKFSTLLKKSFPKAEIKSISVNMGGNLVSAYRAADTPFTPQVTKVLLLTIPPDEKMAAGILDLGVKNSLQPFFGITSYDGRAGALYYGIKEKDLDLKPYLKKAAGTLAKKAQEMAKIVGVKKGKLVYMGEPGWYNDRKYIVYYRDIKVTLPGKFCSSDKNIPISFTIPARYEIVE